ncbi:hypothetical protein V6Z12_A06G029600 [Gossypium hirsutum]
MEVTWEIEKGMGFRKVEMGTVVSQIAFIVVWLFSSKISLNSVFRVCDIFFLRLKDEFLEKQGADWGRWMIAGNRLESIARMDGTEADGKVKFHIKSLYYAFILDLVSLL